MLICSLKDHYVELAAVSHMGLSMSIYFFVHLKCFSVLGIQHRLHFMSYPVSRSPEFVKLLMHVVHFQILYVCSGTALASRYHLPGILLQILTMYYFTLL